MNHTRLEMAQEFSVNLEKERIRLGLSQKELADKLELSLSSYKRLINGETERIDLYIAYKLYQLTGKLAYEFLDVSETYLDLKKKIIGLSASQLAFIDAMIDFEKAFSEVHEDADDYITVFVPTGNMEDGMVYDSANVEKINIASYRKKFGNRINCGIKVTSNHLHPVYHVGDILLISKSPIRDGDTGIFINKENGCVYIRKFRQTSPCLLEPITEYGECIAVDGNNAQDMDKWIKFGVVIAKMR